MSFTLRSFFEDSLYADATTGDVKALQTLVATIGQNIIDTQTALNSAAAAEPAVTAAGDPAAEPAAVPVPSAIAR